MTLQDKIVIVTGGNGLIGRSIIRDITEMKGRVINFELGVDTNIEKGVVNCDVTNSDSVNKALALVYEYYGVIDGLVNNAYPRTEDWGEKFENIHKESWDKNVMDQLGGYFYMCQKVSDFMVQHKKGSIVNIASIYGIVGADFSVYEGTEMTSPAAYSAIKGGLINFTRYLSSYLGKYMIRVNCVSPGGIFDHQPSQFVKNYENKVPLKRLGKPEDIAPAVSFLLSDQASYITGHNLVIDGGWTAI